MGVTRSRRPSVWATVAVLICTLVPSLGLEAASVEVAADGSVIVDGNSFASWGHYFNSQYFRERGGRCGTPDRQSRELLFGADGAAPSDCSSSNTNPSVDYAPGLVYVVPVVVHVITNTAGTQGDISDAMVESQIAILNEDFRTVPGSNGADGTNLRIHFVLAGITRSANDNWFNDNSDPVLGWYYDVLHWDPHQYMNVYTNSARGFLGYVPFLPANGGGTNVGQPYDRVVILWSAFGRDAPFPPYDQGRTATHEIGHYLGLEHPFDGFGCSDSASPPGCYSDGDLICDTPLDDGPYFGCPDQGAAQSCGSPDPIHNYMEYTDDLCMTEFTPEQTRRVRCTLQHYRPDLVELVAIDYQDLEIGHAGMWSDVIEN